MFLSGTYQSIKTIIKAIYFRGFEETYQAWAGVPKDSLKTHRTYNPYSYENEIDNYEQNHANIHLIRTIKKKFTRNFNGLFVGANGDYGNFKEDQKPR